MAETKQHQYHQKTKRVALWPPSQRSRDALIEKLIGTLTLPNKVFEVHGTRRISTDEAASIAKTIEEESFSAASTAVTLSGSATGREIEIVRAYSKEISERMIRVAKTEVASSDSG